MSATTLFRTPSLTCSRKTGNEGPRHDPYGFSEYTVTFRDSREPITLHQGLVEWISIGSDQQNSFPIYDESAESIFAALVGFDTMDADDWSERIRNTCYSCGGHKFKSVRGYPGEVFTVCITCNQVSGSDFDINAVV